MNFMSEMAGSAWSIVPILLILFLMAGIVMAFFLKAKIEEITVYLKSIATSLEKLTDRLLKNELNRGIALELGEAISASGSEALNKKFTSFTQASNSESYADLEYGGNGGRGRQYFFKSAD